MTANVLYAATLMRSDLQVKGFMVCRCKSPSCPSPDRTGSVSIMVFPLRAPASRTIACAIRLIECRRLCNTTLATMHQQHTQPARTSTTALMDFVFDIPWADLLVTFCCTTKLILGIVYATLLAIAWPRVPGDTGAHEWHAGAVCNGARPHNRPLLHHGSPVSSRFRDAL